MKTKTQKLQHNVFDIETISQPEDVVRMMMPKDISEPVMPAKLENGVPPTETHKVMWKKIKKLLEMVDANPQSTEATRWAMQLADAEKEHEEWRAEKAEAWRQEKQIKIEAWKRECLDDEVKFLDRACLNAETAIVPLICCNDPSDIIHIFAIASQKEVNMVKLTEKNAFVLHAAKNEADLLNQWWKHVKATADEDEGNRFTGWNSNKFDAPMLRRRSWICGVKIPVRVVNGRYINTDLFHDLMQDWQCGDTQMYMGVAQAAKALGCKRVKSGSGGNFGTLWRRDKTEAILYCMDDVLCEKEICNRITA